MRLDLMLDCNDVEVMARFWSQALGYVQAPPKPDDPDIMLRHPTDASAPRLWLQEVPEAKQAKNRLHLDLTTDDMEAEAVRLVGLGATRRERFDHPGGGGWIVLQDPEGNELCSCQDD